MQITYPIRQNNVSAVGLPDLRAFETLLCNGASEADVDQFLQRLNSDSNPSVVVKFLSKNFSENGTWRDQLRFLSVLHSQGIYIDRRLGSEVSFIYFSGVVDPTGFALARSRLSRLNANCIYLYDRRCLNYVLGLSQFGAEVRETEAALLRCIRDLGVGRVITMGNSAGGFAAIKYALKLDAYATVAFSPFTTFAEEHHRQDGRGKAVISRLKQLAPETLIDLMPLLSKRDPPLRLLCFFAEGMQKDAWHAKRMSSTHASAIRVNCGATHDVLWPLVMSGIFDNLMRSLAEGCNLEETLALALSHFPSLLKVD